MESPHRWLILAGIALLAGMLGAIAMLAYAWPHAIARIWLWAGIIVTLALLVQALRDWKQRTEARLELEERRQARG
jgi:hypothetical protein